MIGEDLTHAVQEAAREAANIFIGRDRRFSTQLIEDGTGVSEDSQNRYRRGECTPPLAVFIALAAVLPPSFANHVMALAGLVCTRIDDGLKTTPHGTLTGLLRRAEMISRHLEDGRIDHQERPEQIRELRGLVDELNAYVAGLEARR
jgi:hypothetical protein